MKIIVVAGARPNFMKIAPILDSLRERNRSFSDIETLFVHTGQHYDRKMSGDFFEDLGMPQPDINLGIGSGTHAQQTGRIMMAFEEVCMQHRSDWVIVVGDVNSTVACAITAKKLGIRVAHVEAGLRSHDMRMPEEINRLCTDAVADLLFTTDELASENLRREGVPDSKIFFVGNTMIDTLLRQAACARSMPLPNYLRSGEFALLTLHRPGNVDNPETLCAISRAIIGMSERIPIVFPAHPRTIGRLKEFGLWEEFHGSGQVHVIEPLSYNAFLGLVMRAKMVLTDSGGIQEETTVLGIPCLTMRPNTERPITCQIGTNILVGTDPARIRDAVIKVLTGAQPKGSIPEKWDGRAARRIVDVLLEHRDK